MEEVQAEGGVAPLLQPPPPPLLQVRAPTQRTQMATPHRSNGLAEGEQRASRASPRPTVRAWSRRSSSGRELRRVSRHMVRPPPPDRRAPLRRWSCCRSRPAVLGPLSACLLEIPDKPLFAALSISFRNLVRSCGLRCPWPAPHAPSLFSICASRLLVHDYPTVPSYDDYLFAC